MGGVLVECGIVIEDGRIKKIGKESTLPPFDEKVDAKGLVSLPGLIDVHVHLRDMKLAYKEDFYTGTCAAVAGGFTTVIDMPNTIPATDSAERLKEKMEIGRSKAVANFGFHAALTADVDEIEEMSKLGPLSFKLNLHKPIGEFPAEDEVTIVNSMAKCASLKIPVSIHAEDRGTIEKLQFALERDEKRSARDYLEAHGAEAELKAVEKVLGWARESRATVHICHLSVAESLRMISSARGRGSSLTCEVTPHHLFLTSRQPEHFMRVATTAPPVRDFENASRLWIALRNGEIDIVASDHAPHTLKEKQNPDIWKVPPGIPGLETTLPLLLARVNQGQLRIDRLVEALAQKPASVFGLPNKGVLAEGADADIVLVDLKAEVKIDERNFHSKAKYSPFNGLICRGKPVKTFILGQLVMEGGEIKAKQGSGSVIKAVRK